MNELSSRQQHIAELESQLLRMDYEYGIVISSLKQKQKIVQQLIEEERERNRRYEHKNKKLQRQVRNRDKAISELERQVDNLKTQGKEKDCLISQLEQSNKTLANEVKVLQGNLQKYEVKAFEFNKKKQKYRSEIKKVHAQNQFLQKSFQKLGMKNKQLQALVQAEVQETQNRIELISNQIINNGNFPPAFKEQKGQNNNIQTILSCSSISESDWESDMRKLKNCVDYGTQYILVFDPSNLDRMLTRQIFKYIKQCLHQKSELTKQVQNYKNFNEKLINEHKNLIQCTERQLEIAINNQNRLIKIDTQSQTDNINGPEVQKAVFQLSELNLALKLKNSDLLSYIQLIAIRNIVYSNWLKNSYLNCEYLRKANRLKKSDRIGHVTSVSTKKKLKIVSIAVWFFQILLCGKRKWKREGVQKCKKKRRVQQLISEMIQEAPTNPEISRLKDIHLRLEEQEKVQLIEQAIQYYQYKLDQRLSSNSIAKQLVYFYKY